MGNTIDVLSLEKDNKGNCKRIHVRFGPHYLVDIFKEGDKTKLALIATHHGFLADASEVSGELEQIINEIRESRPKSKAD